MTNFNFLKALNSFSTRNNAPNSLIRKSVLSSRIHADFWIHSKDFVLLHPALGFAGGRTLFSLSHGLNSQLGCKRAGTSLCDVRRLQPISAGNRARFPRPWRGRGQEVGEGGGGVSQLGSYVAVSPQSKWPVGCLARPSAVGNTKPGIETKSSGWNCW